MSGQRDPNSLRERLRGPIWNCRDGAIKVDDALDEIERIINSQHHHGWMWREKEHRWECGMCGEVWGNSEQRLESQAKQLAHANRDPNWWNYKDAAAAFQRRPTQPTTWASPVLGRAYVEVENLRAVLAQPPESGIDESLRDLLGAIESADIELAPATPRMETVRARKEQHPTPAGEVVSLREALREIAELPWASGWPTAADAAAEMQGIAIRALSK